MPAVFRVAGALVAAVLAALALVIAVELFSAAVHPLPADFRNTQEEMCQHVERYPNWVLAVVVPAWAGTALVSTWIAGRLGNRVAAYIIGFLLIAAVVFNLAMLPYAVWFKIATLIAIPCGVLGGIYWSRRPAVGGSA